VRAIDTNVLVRVLTGEDSAQGRKAKSAFDEGDLFVPTTVLLESEWVLRSAYGFPADRIAAAFRKLGGLDGVKFEDERLVATALGWVDKGMDFADALHLGRSEGCSAFISFDRKLARIASKLTDVEVVSP
jgi:predicted nucleic-acid-binding protein